MALTRVEVKKDMGLDGIGVIYVKGSIITNIGSTEVATVMDEILKTCTPPKVILNLENVRYLDSYSFNWIIKLMKETVAKGGAFAISNPNSDIINLFDLSSFCRVMSVYRTENEARDAFISGNDSARIGR
jgi:anti-sigma B factor antagonist